MVSPDDPLLPFALPNTDAEFRTTMSREEKVARLRYLLTQSDDLLVMPCCYDGFTARMVEQAGFDLTFMTGFGVSATYGVPDTGLVSAGEMVSSASVICGALRRIPCIGDGDTGYGNAVNVKRTVHKYVQAGLAGIMLEDQVAPKRCGHTKGKSVVSREEACSRIQAAVDARKEGADIVILARTDARATLGLDEAIARLKLFRELGADWTFLEAPQSVEEMQRYCREVDGPKLFNALEGGLTPLLPHAELKAMGYTVAAYPLTLLSAGAKAMQQALQQLKAGQPTDALVLDFVDLQKLVGFPEYDMESNRYAKPSPPPTP
jgi:2-methylisocitrate lyase-like PEP mutase family enzyme